MIAIIPVVASAIDAILQRGAVLCYTMRVHGVKRILTFNEKDFARYHDIEAVHPQAIFSKFP
jgi:predicted nucleic acid-binding protein